MHLTKWVILLAIFWVLLSGFFQPLLLAFGVISVALVTYVLVRMDRVDSETKAVSTGINMGRYIVWLVKEVFKSSLEVTRLVWGNPKNLSPALDTVSAKNVPKNVQVLYANSITLTPGTLSVDLQGDEITVHALRKESLDDLKKGDMEKHLTQIWGEAK